MDRGCQRGFFGSGTDSNLSIVSHNILAESAANPKLFVGASQDVLIWKNRKDKILQNLLQFNPDVICLQEVDHYRDFFLPELSNHGFTGTFKQRTGGKVDGCCTFYKHSEYYVVEEVTVEFNEIAAKAPPDQASKFTTNNVGLILVLQSVSDSDAAQIVIANCHLCWEPGADKVRTAQCRMMSGKIKQLKKAHPTLHGFLCGDFNDTDKSSMYQELITQGFKDSYRDYFNHFQQKESNKEKSAEPEKLCTMYTPSFSATIDFMWYLSSDEIQVSQVLELMTDKQLSSLVGKTLPSKDLPSDHLFIFTKFHLS